LGGAGFAITGFSTVAALDVSGLVDTFLLALTAEGSGFRADALAGAFGALALVATAFAAGADLADFVVFTTGFLAGIRRSLAS
jgi:hypothetical protein